MTDSSQVDKMRKKITGAEFGNDFENEIHSNDDDKLSDYYSEKDEFQATGSTYDDGPKVQR